ncbi:unnamed protein product [Ixodes hexagonus]
MARQVRVLRGFSKVLDWKQLEFLTPLPRVLSCDLCGVLTRRPAFPSCRRFYCAGCLNRVLQQKPPRCPLDDIELEGKGGANYGVVVDDDELMRTAVRCPNAAHGCAHGGIHTKRTHHILSCEYHPVSCTKCGEAVAYKDVVGHHAKSCKSGADEDRKNEESDPEPAYLGTVE